jgi:hypothetical protein
MRRVRADGVGAAPRRDDAASRAGDDFLQDYWGPVRFAFNETFAGEWTESYKMASDPAANCDTEAPDVSDLPANFHYRALPLGCKTPAAIRDEILGNPATDASDVVVVGAARAQVGMAVNGDDLYDELLAHGATVFFVYGAVDYLAAPNPATQLYWTFTPDVETAAQLVAAETCRRFGRGVEHRVLKLYGNDQPAFDIRVDAQLEWLWENCDAKITKTVEARANFDRDLAYELTKKALILDPSITTILAANDRMLLGARAAVAETLSWQGAEKLMVAGFDRVEEHLLDDDFMVASADQYVGVAHAGLWRAVTNVLDAVDAAAAAGEPIDTTDKLKAYFAETTGENRWEKCTINIEPYTDSVVALAAETGVDAWDAAVADAEADCAFYDETTTETETSCQYADAEGFTVDALIHHTSYQATVAAKTDDGSPLPVTATVRELEIQTMDTAGGSFSATAWVDLEWVDTRLKYDRNVFEGPIRVDIDRIWVPEMYIHNLQTPEGLQLIKRLPAEVKPDGTVTYKFRTVGEYGCEMDSNLRNYPYDVHTCSLDVTVAEAESEIDIKDGDIVGKIEGCEGWENPPAKVGNRVPGKTVEFRFEIMRDSQFVSLSYVLVGWAFNLLGFTVFWIRAEGAGIDRSAVAITTILAAQFMMYEAKVTKVFTWLDWYFVIMLIYQFLAFILLVKSSRDYRQQQAAGGDEKFFIRVKAAQSKIRRRSRADDWTFWLFNLMFAGLETNALDRAARRIMVPSFFVVQIVICFVNPTDWSSAVIWQRAGFQALLFWLNFLLLLFYGGLFMTAWFLGQFHEDESSELSHFKKAEKRVQEGIVRLETVFELHGADSLDVQTFFHKWKETSDKLRAREDTINRRRMMRTPQHDERRVQDGSWRSPKHSPVGSVVAVVGSPNLPRPPSVQKPRFIFDPTRVTWFWEETPERISQHPVVRPPYWVPFDEKAASTLEQAMVQERSLVQLSGGKYVADLRTMTQKNQQTSYSRRILREASS